MASYDIAPGYYKTRAFKNGPWIPIRVWLEDGERDTEGKLLSDQIYRAEQNRGSCAFSWTPVDPFDDKNIYWRQITKDEFRWITIQKTL